MKSEKRKVKSEKLRKGLTLLTSLTILTTLAANAATYTLTGERYLRKYTAPSASQVYNAETDAQKIADRMCDVPWTVTTVAQAAATSHVSTNLDWNVANRDQFDAAIFCAKHVGSTHVAYANAAVYRYVLPDGSLPNLTRLAASVYSDPYNAYGARIVLMTNATGEIPTDCATVRGDAAGGIKATNVAARITRTSGGKDFWYPNSSNLVFTAEQLGAGGVQLQKYLFVFVLMENYATSRGNWLEGCAYIDNAVKVTTSAAVSGWTDGATIDARHETEAATVDHDLVEDWWEDAEPTYMKRGRDRLSAYSRKAYDADDWHPAFGLWTKWQVARMSIDHGVTEPLDPSVRILLTYRSRTVSTIGRGIVIRAFRESDGLNALPAATWRVTADWTLGLGQQFELGVPSSGRLSPGSYVFEARLDGDAAGSPCGVAKGVAVSYANASPVTIELTDANESVARIDILAAMVAQAQAVGEGLSVTGVFEAVARHFDRYSVSDGPEVVCADYAGTNMDVSASNVYVRIYRSKVNGMRRVDATIGGEKVIYSFGSEDPVWSGTLNLARHPRLTEADLLAAGKADLDWGTLRSAFDNAPAEVGVTASAIYDADYSVVIGTGTFSNWTNGNVLAAMVENRYELGSEPQPASDLGSTAYGSQPTFFWTHENSIGKSYPAFQLKVMETNGTTVVYDTGVLPAPARDAQGRYVHTANFWPGMMTTNGAVLADRKYVWKVAMLDAKFTTFPSSAAQGTFAIRASGTNGVYGVVNVTVAYSGLGNISTSTPKNLVRLEAYETQDFSGTPVGVGYVSSRASGATTMTGRIEGVPFGVPLYVRAFIDTASVGTRDSWETWGYVHGDGESYAPQPVTVARGTTGAVSITMTDCDTNDNNIPDVWEWNQDGGLGGRHTQPEYNPPTFGY